MAEAITPEMVHPALALLGVDASRASELCCVRTSASKPYIIQAVDDPWCAVWELPRSEAVGKSLNALAGPRSSNARVGAALAAAAADEPLETWVLIENVRNVSAVSQRELHHSLAIGPVRSADGSVCALLGVSRMRESEPPDSELTAHGEASASAPAEPKASSPSASRAGPSSALARADEPLFSSGALSAEPRRAAFGAPAAAAPQRVSALPLLPGSPVVKRRYAPPSPVLGGALAAARASDIPRADDDGRSGSGSDSDEDVHSAAPAVAPTADETTPLSVDRFGRAAEQQQRRVGPWSLDQEAGTNAKLTAAEMREPLFVGLLDGQHARHSFRSALERQSGRQSGSGDEHRRPSASRVLRFRFPRLSHAPTNLPRTRRRLSDEAPNYAPASPPS